MEVLSKLEPKEVFSYFEKLCAVPHGSGNTKEISDLCVNFAKELGLRWRQDEVNNVVIWKDASPGREGDAPVILQGHIDMVCVKTEDSPKDMAKEGLDLRTDGEWVWADKTSLGGDNGIAVAMILAILADDTLPHPALEAVFTVDEEIGLLGAAGLDCSDLKGRTLINLDSEAEGVLTVGCAGGARCDLEVSLPVQPAAGRLCTLDLSGLPGGHSGTEIHKNIPNANRVLAECLRTLPEARLVSLYGGEQDNAIPNRARAVFVLPEEQIDGAAEKFHAVKAGAACSFTHAAHAPVDALSVEDSRRVPDLILSAPNGVQAMEPDLPGQVRTSLNLGILRLEEGALRLTWSVRSSAAVEKEELIAALKALAEGCGGTFGRRGDYPAWEYRPESRLRDVMVRVYRERTGKEPVVETIHAGLECGLLAEKLPGLDAVSAGPDMRDIHSPRERLSVSSVRRTWDYLLAVLAQL